jgi:tetratricopeptide (TPR) repeat protein
MPLVAPVIAAALLTLQSVQGVIPDPALLSVVDRFYETQEREDIEGYLELWSRTASRPTVEQLRFIFESGDDRFADLRITHATVDGARARVRLEVTRTRTRQPPAPGLPPVTTSAPMRVALDFVREAGEWRIVREGPAADTLATDLVEASTDDERERLLAMEPELVDVHLLSALARLGSTAAARQAYPASLSTFQLIVRLAGRMGHTREEGEALQNIGNALYFMQRFDEALSAYARRLALERDREDEAGAAAALAGIATVRYSLAEYSEALARYQDALAIHDRLGDLAGQASTTLSIGHITYLQGDFGAAIDAYTRSLRLSQSLSHADGEARAFEGLGRVHLARGDFAAAVEAFERVRRDGRMQASHDRLGTVAQYLGDVHVRLGNLGVARRMYGEARRHFQARDDLPNVGRVLQGLAFAELLDGRSAAAEAYYKESATVCAAGDDRPCSARAVVALGYAQYAHGSFWGAVASYRSAIAAFAALGRREDAARAEVGLAQALAGAGDTASAIDAAIRARIAAESLGTDDVLWRALLAEARAIRRAGQTTRALGTIRRAVNVVDRMADAARDRPGSSVPADASEVLGLLAMLEADTGHAEAAFAAIEGMRALERRARLAPVEREIARGMTGEEREAERRHAADVTTVLAQITRETGLPRPDAARLTLLRRTLDERMAARRAWIASLFARRPDLRTWRGLAEPPSHHEAAALLTRDDELLISLYLDLDGVLAVTVRRDDGGLRVDADVSSIPRREVQRRVGVLRQPEIVADERAWRESARAMAALLPTPMVERLSRASRVYVLPHDILWRVPFAALPIDNRLLIDTATVMTGGSLEGLLRSLDRPTLAAGEVVAIGSPAIAAARIERLYETAPAWLFRDPADVHRQLDAGDGEGGAPIVLTGAGASEAALRRHAARAGVLHVAAPFWLSPGSPLFSAVLLADGSPTSSASAPAGHTGGEHPGLRRGGRDDGLLELGELFTLDASARVALLTDGGALAVRDAASAADLLQWSWLAAGVSTLVVSRWAAPADGDPGVLVRFHRELRRGAGAADALRRAQLAVRSEAPAPVHWAGWLLMGAW